MFSISLESCEVKEFEEEYKKFVVAVNDFAEDIFSDPCLSLAEAEFRVLYQINLIRRFLIAVSIARHGDLALQIPLIGY